MVFWHLLFVKKTIFDRCHITWKNSTLTGFCYRWQKNILNFFGKNNFLTIVTNTLKNDVLTIFCHKNVNNNSLAGYWQMSQVLKVSYWHILVCFFKCHIFVRLTVFGKYKNMKSNVDTFLTDFTQMAENIQAGFWQMMLQCQKLAIVTSATMSKISVWRLSKIREKMSLWHKNVNSNI